MKYLQSHIFISFLCWLTLTSSVLGFQSPAAFPRPNVRVFGRSTPGKLPGPLVVKRHPMALNVAAPVVTSTLATIALPSAKTILLANLLPTCIGFYKYEYGVSYAYGTATATTAYFALRALLSAPTSAFTAVAQIHAAAIVFYGIRLNLFLLYREFFNERFRKMREKIEARQTKKEVDTGLIGRFLNRTPFIISCAMLYAGLAAPALSSAKLIQIGAAPTCEIALLAYKGLVGLTWFGYMLGAVGDVTKSAVKGKKGPDHLVTGGVFSLFRHPNYTGEIIGWSSNFLASIVAISGTKRLDILKTMSPALALGSLGVVGILFVLCAATGNLESRQLEKYGKTDEYKAWVKKSWSGPKLAKKV